MKTQIKIEHMPSGRVYLGKPQPQAIQKVVSEFQELLEACGRLVEGTFQFEMMDGIKVFQIHHLKDFSFSFHEIDE